MASGSGISLNALLLQSALVLLAGIIATFSFKLYHVRHRFQTMQKEGLPMPPHHPVLGHLQLMGTIMSKLPKSIHGHVLPQQIERHLPNLGPIFYLDPWPFAPPMLIVAQPDLLHQVTQSHSLPKFPGLRDYMRPMTGGNDLVSLEGVEWKRWRNVFNSGFSSGHLMTLVPDMMKDLSTFCEILRKFSKQPTIVLMDPLTTRLSLDIIGRVALDIDINAQTRPNAFVKALRSQARWLSFENEVNPFKRYHPLRPIAQWWNDRHMKRFIANEVLLRFTSNLGQSEVEKKDRSKTIIDLALNNYLSQQAPGQPTTTIDSTFRDMAISQIRTFVFAGHDSTSSTMCYVFHLLSQHPIVRKRLIDELDRVIGPDIGHTATRISQDPHLISQLYYTTGIVKETLRLYPPASSLRSGEVGYSIQTPGGGQLPTDGFVVWANSYAIHRDPNYWPDSENFLPERWLAKEGERLYPVKGAYRPFEFGPRNCIGQELAMLELKLVLVMTAREFNIRSAYEEWDQLHPCKGPKTIDGDRAYQILDGAAHPCDGFPCIVSLAA
ncbi:hypothetical protein MMC25_007080 [Agyrium rufum]|nr:hypothetical protein [Agyrium rufum]